MIEATIKIEAIPEKRLELLQALRSMINEIRKEDGCKHCYFYQDVDNENIFSLIEEWKTQEELENHLSSDMFHALKGTKFLLVKPPEINLKVITYAIGEKAIRKISKKKND